MAKAIALSRNAVIGIVTLSLLSGGGVAVANANGIFKEPNSTRVSQKYSIVKICDGINLLYVNDSGIVYTDGLFQVIHNAKECGGTN